MAKDIFLVQQEKEVILGAEFLCNIFHNITKKQPSPSAHAHVTEKPNRAGQGPWQHQGLCPRSVVALAPWSITTVLQTAAKLQLKATERFSRGHLGRPPNSLASALTAPSLCLKAELAGGHQEAQHCSQGMAGSQ